MSLDLSGREVPPATTALLVAYPGLDVSEDGTTITIPGGPSIAMGAIRDVNASERLRSATVAEQFYFTYPLDFDLEERLEPFVDPGRLRNDAFFRALYFENEDEARESLTRVQPHGISEESFWMTEKWGVACQLTAAFAELAAKQEDYKAYFTDVGGSFVWRRISGTARLSAHSFGISFDLNPRLGQYWRWSGAREGDAGEYVNEVPESLVSVMEKYGFIWGGKWHHFDGMHFEYRPELILYSRIIGRWSEGLE